MEIGPIPAIRSLATVRERLADVTPAVFDIEASAKPGGDSGQTPRRKAAGAEEDDDDSTVVDELGAGAAENGQPSRIDTFA
jgi:hypothetical protein